LKAHQVPRGVAGPFIFTVECDMSGYVHNNAPEDDDHPALRWFEELVRSLRRLDRNAAENARRKLAFRGWRIWHRRLPDIYAAVTDHELCADRRGMLRIWEIAPLAHETIETIGRWVSVGELPPPTIYDELGPAWERVPMTAWIAWRKG
jgi:hypothetical protein